MIQFSPFDDVFKKYAGPLAGNPEFISIVAAGTKAESQWNPNNTTGDGGHSWGLFQMHDMGAGAGMGAARLDPDTASSVMVPIYAQAYTLVKNQNPGLSGAALASLVAGMAERPQEWQDANSAARQRYATAWNQIAGIGNLIPWIAPPIPAPIQIPGQVTPGLLPRPSQPNASSANTWNLSWLLLLLVALFVIVVGAFLARG